MNERESFESIFVAEWCRGRGDYPRELQDMWEVWQVAIQSHESLRKELQATIDAWNSTMDGDPEGLYFNDAREMCADELQSILDKEAQ